MYVQRPGNGKRMKPERQIKSTEVTMNKKLYIIAIFAAVLTANVTFAGPHHPPHHGGGIGLALDVINTVAHVVDVVAPRPVVVEQPVVVEKPVVVTPQPAPVVVEPLPPRYPRPEPHYTRPAPPPQPRRPAPARPAPEYRRDRQHGGPGGGPGGGPRR